MRETFTAIGREASRHDFVTTLVKGVFAGWLIALIGGEKGSSPIIGGKPGGECLLPMPHPELPAQAAWRLILERLRLNVSSFPHVLPADPAAS